MTRLRLWTLEKIIFPLYLRYERLKLRACRCKNKQAEAAAHLTSRAGTRAVGKTAGRAKARSPRVRARKGKARVKS